VTRSFGWDSSHCEYLLCSHCKYLYKMLHYIIKYIIMLCLLYSAWQQHDVQELCRVMFDALEINWKKTDQADLINNLYQGKLKDYVKCLEVSFVVVFPLFKL